MPSQRPVRKKKVTHHTPPTSDEAVSQRDSAHSEADFLTSVDALRTERFKALTPASIVALQQRLGNASVQRLAGSLLQMQEEEPAEEQTKKGFQSCCRSALSQLARQIEKTGKYPKWAKFLRSLAKSSLHWATQKVRLVFSWRALKGIGELIAESLKDTAWSECNVHSGQAAVGAGGSEKALASFWLPLWYQFSKLWEYESDPRHKRKATVGEVGATAPPA